MKTQQIEKASPHGFPVEPTFAMSVAYLDSCSGRFEEIDWERLTPIAQRIVFRLIASEHARAAHLTVLAGDDLAFHETALVEADDLLAVGPFSDKTPPLDYFRIIRDFEAIETLAQSAARCSLGCWSCLFSEPMQPFVVGDRDDRAAWRLYELAKLCPMTAEW